ncbi:MULTISPECIES: PHP domain-containing protein [Cryobacterium]|uniref:PHP domain-containing protein n=1 Tax=Cryobacterium breve TaxID=1259258 RepID=A0ABY2J6M7_9MICO|nr:MULTISPECIES: PHP domain-containing protein [Cryobacterium]TFC91042.1 PHP domain-containing protein [Cryobacterium sp. TmT3-12]TFC99361.1 PHP domain-containing protein [Cryobacterium breve]
MSGARRFRDPIDLHTHSSVSDGTETPSQLVRAAVAAGLGTVALTDHDSTAGWAEASAAARAAGITLIPGMEFSTRVGYASVHLLAYLFDPSNAGIVAETARVRQARLVRAEQMVERIGVDYALTWDDVLAQTTPDATVGRPHIADALVARGLALTRSEAFAGILHWEAGYYQPHYAPDPLRAITLVRAAGGVPVIAHPATRGVDDVIAEAQLAKLTDAGLFGLELEHRENRPEAKARLYALAEKYGLFVTGSSDYHGEGKPNRLGENTTDPEVLDRIIEQGAGSPPIFG